MPRNLKLSDVMVKDVITIDKGDPVRRAIELMERSGISHLVVTHEGKLVGVLSARDLMEGLGSSRFERIPARRIYVSALMSEPPVTAKPDMSVAEAVRLMIDMRIGALPILDGAKLSGIVTESDLIKLLNPEGSVLDFLRRDHPRIMPNERIVHARAIMLEREARILPVVDSGRLTGLITEMVLAKAFFEVRDEIETTYMDDVARRVIVEDVMIESPRALISEDDLRSAKQAFLDTGLPALPVIDEKGKVMGVIERRSILRFLL